MKLVNFLNRPDSIRLWRAMRIPMNYAVDFNFRTEIRQQTWKDPLKQGKEILITDPEFKKTEDGLLYGNKRVIVYINNQQVQYVQAGSNYKFHLTWCRTLDSMSRGGRYSKYVVSTNTDGYFRINYVDGENVVKQSVEKLYVCKNCLMALNWHDYSNKKTKEKNKIYNDFNLEEFFAAYNDNNESNFAYTPRDTDVTAPDNIYPPDWKALSRMYRERHNWTCEECGRKMSMEERGKLHVHHRDGVKSNCQPSNLVVLCRDCHQKQHPDHRIGTLW